MRNFLTDRFRRGAAAPAGRDSLSSSRERPAGDHAGQSQDRSCMICRKNFASEWTGQRICPRCHSAAEKVRGGS